MTGIGHNRGPALGGGGGWRTHCWRTARAGLLPTLPVEVLRTRVKRARDLGLPYKTYAGIRAQTGHDIVAFLFSSNGLQVDALKPRLSGEIAGKLAVVQALRIGLASAPLRASVPAANRELDAAHPAPYALARFPDTARQLHSALGKTPADRVLLVAQGALERDWCAAGRLAGWISADHYFSA